MNKKAISHFSGFALLFVAAAFLSAGLLSEPSITGLVTLSESFARQIPVVDDYKAEDMERDNRNAYNAWAEASAADTSLFPDPFDPSTATTSDPNTVLRAIYVDETPSGKTGTGKYYWQTGGKWGIADSKTDGLNQIVETVSDHFIAQGYTRPADSSAVDQHGNLINILQNPQGEFVAFNAVTYGFQGELSDEDQASQIYLGHPVDQDFIPILLAQNFDGDLNFDPTQATDDTDLLGPRPIVGGFEIVQEGGFTTLAYARTGGIRPPNFPTAPTEEADDDESAPALPTNDDPSQALAAIARLADPPTEAAEAAATPNAPLQIVALERGTTIGEGADATELTQDVWLLDTGQAGENRYIAFESLAKAQNARAYNQIPDVENNGLGASSLNLDEVLTFYYQEDGKIYSIDGSKDSLEPTEVTGKFSATTKVTDSGLTTTTNYEVAYQRGTTIITRSEYEDLDEDEQSQYDAVPRRNSAQTTLPAGGTAENPIVDRIQVIYDHTGELDGSATAYSQKVITDRNGRVIGREGDRQVLKGYGCSGVGAQATCDKWYRKCENDPCAADFEVVQIVEGVVSKACTDGVISCTLANNQEGDVYKLAAREFRRDAIRSGFSTFFELSNSYRGLDFYSQFIEFGAMDSWREGVDKFFAENYLGTEYWASALCSEKIESENGGATYVDTGGTFPKVTAHVEGSRSESVFVPAGINDTELVVDGNIISIDELDTLTQEQRQELRVQLVEQYLYKITFRVTNGINDQDPAAIDEMQFQVFVKGPGSKVALYNQPIRLDEGDEFAAAGRNAIIQYSENFYDEICIEFTDVPHTWTLNGKELCNVLTGPQAPTILDLSEETPVEESGDQEEEQLQVSDI